jgi:hypothetical protein
MSEVTGAIAAATSVAASLGLLADDAIVLHNSNKLALRLTPCDAFARVARVGQEVAQFEVSSLSGSPRSVPRWACWSLGWNQGCTRATASR